MQSFVEDHFPLVDLEPASSVNYKGIALGQLCDLGESLCLVNDQATGAVGKCAMVPSTGISLMNRAISQRQAVIGSLGSLSVNVIPGGHAMLADLKRVLQRSITADHGFIGWMQDIQATACPVNTSTDASFQQGFRASASAVRAKKEFLARWNPIARKFGQPTFTSAEI